MTHRLLAILIHQFLALTLSLITHFLSLKTLLSKTLHFLPMNSYFNFHSSAGNGNGDGEYSGNAIAIGTGTGRVSRSLFDIEDEKLYLVDHRWWSETRESVLKEVDGVLYAAGSRFNDVFESEIVLNMVRSARGGCGEGQGGSGREYALILEWMFYRTIKWHYDMKNAENLVAEEDNKADLFSLQVKLSIFGTNSLVVKINEMDNAFGDFKKCCQIFNVSSCLLKIWDFSGRTTKFFLKDGMVPDNIELANEEVPLELQVYGLCYDDMPKGSYIEIEDLETEPTVNGHSDKVNPYVRLGQPPLASSFNEPQKLGLTGLSNLGNTCYMNSAVQCLAHTPHFVDYFLGDFRRDLNFENPLGMNGKLALAFGDLLRQLWTPGTNSVSPTAFKSRLACYAPQFGGYNQHDSQEFLAFLLDGLHEDLNRVKLKPYNEIKDIDGISDQEVADEHWRNHLARNDSIVVDLCQGQYRSTLTCPVCTKHSVTFDPFLYLSLPLPLTTTRTMTLTVLATDGSHLPVPVTVTVLKYGKFKDLIEALSVACSLRDDETLLVAEIFTNSILRFFDKPDDYLELVRDNDQLVAYRLPKDQESQPFVVFSHCYHEESNGRPDQTVKRFGFPLVARIPECGDGSVLHKTFLRLMKPFVMPEGFSLDFFDEEPVNNANQDSEMADVAVDDVSSSDDVKEIFDFLLERPGFFQTRTYILMDQTLIIPESRKLRILASWREEVLKQYDTCILDRLPKTSEFSSRLNNLQEVVTLSECLEAFLKDEPLGPEDMWLCPNCKEHRQASKKLDLWRLPEVLVIHLKRFSYTQYVKDKLEAFVDFPIADFDFSSYTVHRYLRPSMGYNYKLYAVSNHYGGMGGGHYTAFAQHGGQWYEFNDNQVSPISEDQIKTADAYVLFYKRI
ncbi:ubiquitin carboxyl-terminal hydrolase 8-like [Bidens hawaiensis]|uniref:ubiquitin carboxyl-terminal hydrolase 8-like n=1 Tax=Bidens hawaiensis TaxID=980011 RepID=UPI00404AB7C8